MLTGATAFRNSFILMLIIASCMNLFADRLKVDKIKFSGNTAIGSSELKSILKSEEGEPFNNKLLRIDKVLIQNYYKNRGYLNIWVNENIERSGDKISIFFEVKEGYQFRLGEISVSGGQLLTNQELRKYFEIKKGDIFHRQAIENGLNKIENYYYNHGKPYVELNESQSQQDSLISINLKIKENQTVYIRDIGYSGLELSKIFLIRRELEFKRGDIYSRKQIDESQRNVYGTGLFEYVGVDLKAMDSSRTSVRVMIKVVEKKPRWVGLRFGVAYEQETVYGGTFDFTLEFGHRNLFGTARTVTFNVIPSLSYDFDKNSIINPKNQYSMTFVEPWIGYTRTPGIFRLAFYQVRPVNSADYNYFTSSFQVKHQFNQDWQASGVLAFNRVNILEGDTLSRGFFSLTSGQDFIYSISGNVIRDKRDNYLNPQNGAVLESNLKIAYSNSRNDRTGETSVNRFIKLELKWNRYQKFPFIKGWIIATRLKGGNIFELGKRAQVPILERYYLGGASSVRGYPEQLLGPTYIDPETGQIKAIGGKLSVLGNVELRFPIFWLFWGEIFTDAGNVWLETTYFNPADIRSSSGAGLALVTPLGPIRFDYGIKHFPKKNEDRGEFHIGISFAF